MARDPRKDRAIKKRRRRRQAAWADRTAAARYPKLLRRMYPLPMMSFRHPSFHLLPDPRIAEDS